MIFSIPAVRPGWVFNRIIYSLNINNMENIDKERQVDAEEIKKIWRQLAFGTILALAGLLYLGFVEAVARWIEN